MRKEEDVEELSFRSGITNVGNKNYYGMFMKNRQGWDFKIAFDQNLMKMLLMLL